MAIPKLAMQIQFFFKIGKKSCFWQEEDPKMASNPLISYQNALFFYYTVAVVSQEVKKIIYMSLHCHLSNISSDKSKIVKKLLNS